MPVVFSPIPLFRKLYQYTKHGMVSKCMPSIQDQLAMKTLLVVEDDAAIGSFLSVAISQETHHKVMLVPDAFQALTAARTIKPDLFVLDFRLPGMNGIQLYDVLHSEKALQHVPAIMVSATLPKREISKRSIVGLSKPIELNVFLDTIDQLLG